MIEQIESFLYNLFSLIVGVMIGTYVATKFVAMRTVKKEALKILNEIRDDDRYREFITGVINDILDIVEKRGTQILRKIINVAVEYKETSVPPPPNIELSDKK